MEPPVIEMSSPGGEEGSLLPLILSARLTDQSTAPLGLHLQVTNVPEGSTFNKGTFSDGIWTFNHTEFGYVELTPPRDFSGSIQLEATAVSSEASKTGFLQVSVQAVADPPNLLIEEACFDSASGSITLDIQSSLTDTDGSENLSVILEVPENFSVTTGQRNTNGFHVLNSSEFGTVEILVSGVFEPVALNVSAVSTEEINGDTAYTNVSLYVQLCETTETSGNATATPEAVPVTALPAATPTPEVIQSDNVTVLPAVTPTLEVVPSDTVTAPPAVTPTLEVAPTDNLMVLPTVTPTPEVTPSDNVTVLPAVTPTPEVIPSDNVTVLPDVTSTPEVIPTDNVTALPAVTPTSDTSTTPDITLDGSTVGTPKVTVISGQSLTFMTIQFIHQECMMSLSSSVTTMMMSSFTLDPLKVL